MESCKTVTTAVPIVNAPKNMSSQEFQDLLTSWYEEKGVLSQIRTQLRFKMINVLRNTAIGRDITRKTSQTSISLSKQAINLIVAEFLMKSNCDYSLSLFNTEAGLSSTYSDNFMSDSGKINIQFDKENIISILELIGVHKMSELCEDILSIYYENSENTSLLSCLINILSKSLMDKNVQHPDLMQRSHIDLTAEPDFIRQVGMVLMDSNISLENILHIIQLIKCLHKSEIENLEENYNKTLSKLKKALAMKEKQIEFAVKKKKMTEIKLLKMIGDYNALKHHTKKMIKDRAMKEQEMNNLKNNVMDETKEDKNLEVLCSCSLKHCGEKCKENNTLLLRLQNENQELTKMNLKQSSDFHELQRKYSDLLHDFHFLQNKVSLLNIKVNEEMPTSHLNLNLIEGDMKYINREHRHKKVDTSDSSDSITEDVIRDARVRLEQLEKESKEIVNYDESCVKSKV